IRQRLELFVDVCQAVQHAHQKGIIHRDKPTNVMVTLHDGQPVVKVIDFGIAKALGQQLTEKTLFTNFAQLIGTPLYMSPEQAEMSGLDVDTRGDVYSLGVLLYELLTGTTPFENERLSKVGYDEMRRIIREEEPPKPSVRMSTVGKLATTASQKRQGDTRKLSKLFRGELDWIVMKALEKDRNRRYETATGFALDVNRYLNDEPVEACPPSAGYRFRKFARRRRAALVMAACVLLALSGIVGSVGWAVRDKAARNEASEIDRLAREKALDQAVERSLEETGPLIEEGKWPEALAILERTEQLLAAAKRTERPPRLLELTKAVAVARRLEAIYRGARHDVKPRLPLATAQETEHETSLPPRVYDEASFWGRQQDTDFAKAFRDLGIDVDDVSPVEAAAKIRLQSIRAALVRALDGWASLRKRSRGDSDSAWKKLLEIARQSDPDDWRNRCRDALLKGDRPALEKLADAVPMRQTPPESLCLLGDTLAEMGGVDKAMTLLERAQHEYPGDLWLNDALAALSWNYCHPPRWDDALRYYTAVLALRPDFAPIHLVVGDAFKAKGATDAALLEYSKAIELDARSVGMWTTRGDLYRALGRYDEANADYSKAIALQPNNAKPHIALGQFHARKGEWKEAAASLARAVELDPKDHYTAFQLGFLLAELADLSAYQKYCNIMLSRWGKVADPMLADQTAKPCLLLAGGVSDPEQLAPLVQTALSEGEKRDLYLWFLFAQGLHDYRCGRFAEARTACATSRERAPSDHFAALTIADQMVEAMSLHRLGKTDEARQALAAADRLLYAKGPKLDSGDLGAGWHDWLCCRILRREAEETTRAHLGWPPSIELDPSDAKGHKDLGQLYARKGQWKQAAAALDHALEADPANRDLWNLAAAARAALGDLEDYRRTCAQIVERFGDATDKQTAERCAKACLLLPDALSNDDFQRVQKLAERAVTGIDEDGAYQFFAMAKGMADYRAGRYREAIKWIERSAPQVDGTHGDATSFAVIGMAQHRLGHEKEAAAAFINAQTIMMKMPDPRNGQLFGAGDWHGWVHAQVLCREAETLLPMDLAHYYVALSQW
ncbi:MAG: tetratricopeptide repeat protein, partial [Pirellulales bacterium]